MILACRSREKAEHAVEKINSTHPHSLTEYMHLDLSDLSSVKDFALEFNAKYKRLDILINNAGVMAIPKKTLTVDGFEMQFGTNHLGHFALTHYLMENILSTSGSRIVNISSIAHKQGSVDFNNLNAEKRYGAWTQYRLSKLSNLLFTYELDRRLKRIGRDSMAVAAHPGYSATNLQKSSKIFSILNKYFAQSAYMGALPTLYAATVQSLKGGEYIGPSGLMEFWGNPMQVDSTKISHDIKLAERLWTVSEELTKIKYDI